MNAAKKKITLSAQGSSFTIKGNEKLIFEMIYNLVDNATIDFKSIVGVGTQIRVNF